MFSNALEGIGEINLDCLEIIIIITIISTTTTIATATTTNTSITSIVVIIVMKKICVSAGAQILNKLLVKNNQGILDITACEQTISSRIITGLLRRHAETSIGISFCSPDVCRS